MSALDYSKKRWLIHSLSRILTIDASLASAMKTKENKSRQRAVSNSGICWPERLFTVPSIEDSVRDNFIFFISFHIVPRK